jgi:hypothetical protein
MKAFPNPHRTDELGMTLRDYFAAKALPFALSECALSEDYDVNSPAELAYQFADAMLKERVK